MADMKYDDLTADERAEAMEVAAQALRLVSPQKIEGLDELVPPRKRADIGDTLLDNLHVTPACSLSFCVCVFINSWPAQRSHQACSPLIALGLQLLQGQLGDKVWVPSARFVDCRPVMKQRPSNDTSRRRARAVAGQSRHVARPVRRRVPVRDVRAQRPVLAGGHPAHLRRTAILFP